MYEHGGNSFKTLHHRHCRNPLSFCRASVQGSQQPATVTLKAFECLLGLEP